MQKTTTNTQTRLRYLVDAGVIAALYAALSIVSLSSMSYLSWGPVQIRPSEALMVLALITPAAIPGLTIGCFIANLFNLTAAGPLGWLDLVFGTLATLLAVIWIWKFRSRTNFALFGAVLSNGFIVAAYLPIILMGLGLYNIPLLNIDIESSYLLMYLFGVVSIGIGQTISVFGLGLPLLKLLKRYKVLQREDS